MFRDIWKLLARHGPEARVSLKWLFQSPGKINTQFVRDAKVEIIEEDSVLQVRINGEPFIWPKNVPVDDLVIMVGELALANHPHQYLWGKTQINSGDIALDIGACEGGFAVLAAEKGARVIVVEPSVKMQRVIERLFECRNLPRPQIVGCALGATNGFATLAEEPDHPAYARLSEAGGKMTSAVKVIGLDELVEQQQLARVDFIKCDAEGYDVDIIKSGEKTLRRDRPRLAICTYHHDDHYNQLAEYLIGLGYHVEGKGFLHSPGKFRVLMLHAW
jgi:FkbM family methyltransferase